MRGATDFHRRVSPNARLRTFNVCSICRIQLFVQSDMEGVEFEKAQCLIRLEVQKMLKEYRLKFRLI